MNSYITRIRLLTIDKALVNKIIVEATALALANKDFAESHTKQILYNDDLQFTTEKIQTSPYWTWLCCYEVILCERVTTLLHLEDCLTTAAKANGVRVTSEILQEDAA